MVRFTAEPDVTPVPASGFSLITLPEGTVALLAVLTVPTVRPAPVSAPVAPACVRPTTFGTDTGGPVLTVRFTAEPYPTLVPASGFSLITLPEGTVALLAVLTVPTVRPAPVSALVAPACVRPTTFGTDTLLLPVSATVCGEPTTLLAIDSDAASDPGAAGLNSTETVQVTPAANEVPQVLAEMRKDERLEPLIVSDVSVTAELPALFTVTT
jgi:hypothetical protein